MANTEPAPLHRQAIADALAGCYRLAAEHVRPGPAGTATSNYLADIDRRTVFVKCYGLPGARADQGTLADEAAAVELSDYAGRHGVPTPALTRTTAGEPLGVCGDTAISVWQYLPGDIDPDPGLSPDQLAALGSVVGRLHRATTSWPGLPARRRADLAPAIDAEAVPGRLAHLRQLIADADAHGPTDRAWLERACAWRAAAWPRLHALAATVPPLTHQVGHGDLASVNVLLFHRQAPMLVDFRPPRRIPVLYDISRISLDPRTVTGRSDWVDGLLAFLQSYRAANPRVAVDELCWTVRFGLLYTAHSTYPLAELARGGQRDQRDRPASLWRYGRARQLALEMIHDRLAYLDSRLASLHASSAR